MLFYQLFSTFSGPVPLTIPCYFCQCVQAQILLDSQLGSGQPVPASINFFHTALRQHYANHFLEALTWSYLQLCTTASAKGRQQFSLLVAAWIIHLQLLTSNQRLATVLPSRLPAALAIPPIFARSAPPRRQVPWRSRPLRLVKRSAFHVHTSSWAWVASPYCFVLYPLTHISSFSVLKNNYAPQIIAPLPSGLPPRCWSSYLPAAGGYPEHFHRSSYPENLRLLWRSGCHVQRFEPFLPPL